MPGHPPGPHKFTVTFLDDADLPADPVSGIAIRIRDPHLTFTSYAFPAQVTRESQGVYSVIVACDTPGTWIARGQGTLTSGLFIATEDESQPIDRSVFDS